MYKPNNLILRSTTSIIIFVLLGFAIYLLFAGHNSPGGGFVGGLTTSAAILLMFMTYGESNVRRFLPINYINLVPLGLLIATVTGLSAILFNVPFLTHVLYSVYIPFFGFIDIGTAMFFDLGVYVTVLGTTMTIILTIAQDRDFDLNK